MPYYKLVLSFLLASLTFISHSSFAAVVTSIKPLAFISAAITDGVTTTEVLLPDGASPHTYALRPSDIKRLRDAELVVWVGEGMEAFLDKPLQPLPERQKITLATLPAIKTLLLSNEDADDHHHESDHDEHDDHDHDHGAVDMHIWLSPEIAKQIAIAIHDRLIEIYPEDKPKLDINLQLFMQELEREEKNLGKILEQIKGKGYFVFHDAYQYYENYFGLTQSGHFTINPEIQPGAQRLHQIRTQLVEQKAQCVFAEPQFRPAIINSVTQGLNVKHGILDPLGVNINVSKGSYLEFLNQLSSQFVSCLKDET
jgi:zinc transport system substrate-binding protein